MQIFILLNQQHEVFFDMKKIVNSIGIK